MRSPRDMQHMRTIAKLIAFIEETPGTSEAATLAKQLALAIATSRVVREDWNAVLDQTCFLVSDAEIPGATTDR